MSSQQHFGEGDIIGRDKVIINIIGEDNSAQRNLNSVLIEKGYQITNTSFWNNGNTIFIRWIFYIPLYFVFQIIYYLLSPILLYLSLIICAILSSFLPDIDFVRLLVFIVPTIMMFVFSQYFLMRVFTAISFNWVHICPDKLVGSNIYRVISEIIFYFIFAVAVYFICFDHRLHDSLYYSSKISQAPNWAKCFQLNFLRFILIAGTNHFLSIPNRVINQTCLAIREGLSYEVILSKLEQILSEKK